ncbi:MAG: glutamate racemase [Phycisphaerae bacterium]
MQRPIGIFDSGLGGLTVVRAVRRRLPAEAIVYFGDTARVPYGIKSPRTVTRFAAEACRLLARHEPKCLVAACNTASATALPALADGFDVPVLGVIEPGVAQALATCPAGPIGVIATEATVGSGAYRRAIARHGPEIRVVERACPLLVPIVEEGRSPDDPIVRAVLAEYLAPLAEAGVGAVVLGCTHYPLLKPAIAAVLGPDVPLVDSAEAVAEGVADRLRADGCLAEGDAAGGWRFFVSDNPDRFREVGGRFLGQPAEPVTLVPAEALSAVPDPVEETT